MSSLIIPTKMFKKILIAIIGFLSITGISYGFTALYSGQVGTNPTNGNILQTDGTNSTWVTPTSVSPLTWQVVNGYLTPTTTITANLNNGFLSQASSTQIGNLSIFGNVGIGTTTGIHNLDIDGPNAQSMTVTSETANANALIRVLDGISGGTLNQGVMRINLSATNNATLSSVPYSLAFATGASTTAGIYFDSVASNAPIIFGTGGTALSNERMRITGTGYIAVGTTTPLAAVHISSPFISTTTLAVQATTSQTAAVFDVWSSTGNVLFNVQPTGNVNIANGSLTGTSATNNFLNVTGTLATVNTIASRGVFLNITSAGTSSFFQNAFVASLNPGYTGSSGTRAMSLTNSAAGTGTAGWTGLAANYGLQNLSNGNGTGQNIGAINTAANSSSLNLGELGQSISGVNSPAVNIGLAGLALNGTTTIGGFFGLMSTAPTLATSSALTADNGATANAIFTAQKNGSIVDIIDKLGNVGIGTSVPADLLHVNGTLRVQNSTNAFQLTSNAASQTLDPVEFTDTNASNANFHMGLTAATSGKGVYYIAHDSNNTSNRFFFGIDSTDLNRISYENSDFAIFSGGFPGTERARITSGGLFGIGTSSPTALESLEVASSTAAVSQGIPFGRLFAGTVAGIKYMFESFDYYGHKYTSGPTPSVTGGTSSVSGNDNNGTITVTGTLLTSVTLNFAKPWLSAPDCVIADSSTGLTAAITSISSSQMTVGFSVGLNSGAVYYQCTGHK